jgi:hypothetical protein
VPGHPRLAAAETRDLARFAPRDGLARPLHDMISSERPANAARAPEEITVNRRRYNAIQLLEALWDRADEAKEEERVRRRQLEEDAERRLAEWRESQNPAA